MARPSSYSEEYAEQAFKLCLLGCTDAELAEFFEVSEVTINAWKNEHAAFLKSIKEGKRKADADVANSLYSKAMAGDTTACIFWLKNRRKAEWRDKQEHEVTGADGGPIQAAITVEFVKPTQS